MFCTFIWKWHESRTFLFHLAEEAILLRTKYSFYWLLSGNKFFAGGLWICDSVFLSLSFSVCWNGVGEYRRHWIYWLINNLNKCRIVSFSRAHSDTKLKLEKSWVRRDWNLFQILMMTMMMLRINSRQNKPYCTRFGEEFVEFASHRTLHSLRTFSYSLFSFSQRFGLLSKFPLYSHLFSEFFFVVTTIRYSFKWLLHFLFSLRYNLYYLVSLFTFQFSYRINNVLPFICLKVKQ